ncbi:MAG: SusC/RagA family TonB-linked outer membrane protein [Pedobacter sp.]|uniref:SusC/RagA family TonB-linked outer membrane protein n=1 Tax=Pedobacter sp. TaxID=1411316 RepID=UPI00339408C9
MYRNYTRNRRAPALLYKKIMLIMRLTTVLLILSLAQVSSATLAQKITLSKSNTSLKTILREIRVQSGYVFLYNEAQIKNAKPVSVKVINSDFREVLDLIFQNQPLTFSINEKTVTVTERKPSFLDRIIGAFTVIDVSGRIVDQNGNAVPGATILVKGAGISTISDASGYFRLNRVDEGAVLILSSVGYLTREINVRADLGNVTLEISNAKLDEVVVIAYGTTTRRLNTGSVSTLSGSDITQQPVTNPILGLSGRVPGLFITQGAGYAGATYNASIRGQTSLGFQSSTPLYVIDGIPFGDRPVEQSAGGSSQQGFSPLNNISPDEIESINVLKDADATAIYGSRGANGVILITTKKGKAGKTQLSVDVNTGFGAVTNMVEMLKTSDYLRIRKQAFANEGIIPTVITAPDLFTWDQSGYTDIPDLLMGHTSHQTKAAFNISGGDLQNQFIFGGNFRRETTVMNTSTRDQAVQFHTSMQHRSKDEKFNFSFSASYNTDNNSVPNYNLGITNYSLPPNYPLYKSDGSLYFGPGYNNPLAPFNSISSLKSTNLISSVNVSYRILDDLTIKADAGYNYNNVFSTTITPANASNPLLNSLPTSVLGNNFIKTYIAEPQLNYGHTWGKGKLTALIGGSWQQMESTQPYFVLGTFSNLQLASSINALNILYKSSGYNNYKYDSGFARLEYNYDGKYLISGNIRRDGSSRFGTEKPFGTFGSGAAAWIFSKEDFATASMPWLSFGKLRASYGTIGSDKSIQDYATLSTYNPGIGYGPSSSINPTRINNPYLQWEVTKKLDFAMELGFFQDRIFLSANYYRNRSNNLLGEMPLPIQAGFSSYSANLPATVQNKGFEFELSSLNIKTKDLSWRTSFNISSPRNKLIAFHELENSVYANTYVVGQPLNLLTALHSTGIVDGLATAQDVNGDGMVTSGLAANGSGDFIVAGTSDPKFFGGLSNTVNYKGFQLDFLFQFVNRKARRGDLNFTDYPGTGYNIPVSFLDVPLRYSPRYGTAATNAFYYYKASDAVIESASFVRLKNVALSYTFPAAMSRMMKISSLQVYCQGQNLLTFTSYKGLDPETLTTSLPTLRMLVTGIKFTL